MGRRQILLRTAGHGCLIPTCHRVGIKHAPRLPTTSRKHAKIGKGCCLQLTGGGDGPNGGGFLLHLGGFGLLHGGFGGLGGLGGLGGGGDSGGPSWNAVLGCAKRRAHGRSSPAPRQAAMGVGISTQFVKAAAPASAPVAGTAQTAAASCCIWAALGSRTAALEALAGLRLSQKLADWRSQR